MKQQRALLTPALKARVQEKLKDCIEIVSKKWPDKKFTVPEVRYDVKSTVGGLAYDLNNLIRLNLILCYENEDNFISQTVPHEFAHLATTVVHGNSKQVLEGGKLVTKKIRAHGSEWKAMMVELGILPLRCHSYDVSSLDPRKRSRRGSVISESESALMLKRLQNGVIRMPPKAKLVFQTWLEEHIEENK